MITLTHTKLRALELFTCKGQECPLTCCQGWDVHVESQILEAWRQVEEASISKRLVSAVEQHKDRHVMKMNAAGKCVMLDEDNLCSIHKHKSDQSLLPEICRTYPKLTRTTRELKVDTAKMSCPEITRLVLESGEHPLFVKEEVQKFEVSEISASYIISKEFMPMMETLLNITKYPISVRITAIAEALVELAVQSQQGTLNEKKLKLICSSPRERLYRLSRIYTHNNHIDPAMAGRMWSFAFSMLKIGATQQLIDENLLSSEFTDNLMKASSDEEHAENYREILKLKNRANLSPGKFTTEERYMVNYLKVKFINNGFPFKPMEDNYIASFLYCIYPLVVIQLCLWLHYDYYNKVTDEDVLNIIYRVERVFDHNDRIYRYLAITPDALRLDHYYKALLDL